MSLAAWGLFLRFETLLSMLPSCQLGWKFEVISCLDKDKYAQRLRANNLRHIFGDVFDFIDCALDFTVGKEQYLLDRYADRGYY